MLKPSLSLFTKLKSPSENEMYFPTMNKKWKGRVLNQSARKVYFMGPEFFWNSFLSLTLGLWLVVILWIGHLNSPIIRPLRRGSLLNGSHSLIGRYLVVCRLHSPRGGPPLPLRGAARLSWLRFSPRHKENSRAVMWRGTCNDEPRCVQ